MENQENTLDLENQKLKRKKSYQLGIKAGFGIGMNHPEKIKELLEKKPVTSHDFGFLVGLKSALKRLEQEKRLAELNKANEKGKDISHDIDR